MKCLLVKPWEHPKRIDIENELHILQATVGGHIEVVYPFDDPVVIVCNEDGKIRNLPANRMLKDKDGVAYDVVCGDFLVMGLDATHDFTDLNDDLAAKYMDIFW